MKSNCQHKVDSTLSQHQRNFHISSYNNNNNNNSGSSSSGINVCLCVCVCVDS